MSSAPDNELLIHDEGPLRRCTLARTNRRNALSRELCAQLQSAIKSVAPEIALVGIDHLGDTFSSGADLREVAPALTADDAEPRESPTLRAIWSLFTAIETADTPVVALVDGRCLAGGLELALACDLIGATVLARFFDAHLAGGLLPAGGAAIRLPERIGPARSFRLLVEGIELDSRQALDWGLVDVVFGSRDELNSWLKSLAERLAAHPRGLVAGIKRQLAAERHPRDGRRFELELAELEAYVATGRTDLRSRLQKYS
jgi:enoyl-CoA hydratase/carnithine racemase